MGDYEKAILVHHKAMNIQENVKCNPLQCATTYINLGETYQEMKDYSTALTFYQKCLQIRENKLPKNHPDLGVIYHNLAKLYFSTGEYNMAMKNAQQALTIAEEKLPSNHHHLQEYKTTFEKIHKQM
jgi:tetratricopeptide (TPR) repeat protein